MCYDDYGEDGTIERAWVRARKEHRCYACKETIRIGHRYHATLEKWEGGLVRFRHCARCYAICEALWDAGAHVIDFELNCGEEWAENFGPVPDEVARLAFLTPDEAQALAPPPVRAVGFTRGERW